MAESYVYVTAYKEGSLRKIGGLFMPMLEDIHRVVGHALLGVDPVNWTYAEDSERAEYMTVRVKDEEQARLVDAIIMKHMLGAGDR